MAETVVKMRIDCQEYDNKLKRAADALNRYADGCRKAGGTLEILDDGVMDVVQSLGKMETSSNTASGKVAELTKAFTDLSFQYRQMSEAEKQSEPGKALKKSLDELKERIKDAKKDLKDIQGEIDDTGNSLEKLAGKFGLNLKHLMGWGAAIAAVKGAMELFKRNMETTESTADQYATVQAELNSQVDSFFRNMNEGNFSNFLQGLTDVANRARDAYEAMDELSSFAVRYNPKNRADMAQIDKLLKEARALQAKGDKSGAAAKTEEAKRVAEQAKANTLAYGEREYQAGVKSLQSLLGGTGVKYNENQLRYYSDPANWNKIQESAGEYKSKLQAYKDAEYAYDLAKETFQFVDKAKQKYEQAKRELDSQPIQNLRAYNYLNTRDTAGTKSGDAFVKATEQIYGRQMAEYAADAIQARIDRAYNTATKPTGGTGLGTKTTQELNPLQQVQKDISTLTEEALTADADRLEIIREQIALLQTQAQEYKNIQDMVSGKFTTVAGGKPDYITAMEQESKLPPLQEAKNEILKKMYESSLQTDQTTFSTLLQSAVQSGINSLDPDFASLQEKMAEGMDIPDEAWQKIIDEYNELRKAIGENPIEIDFKTGSLKSEKKEELSSFESGLQDTQKVVSGLSSVTSGLQQLGVKLPEGVQQFMSGVQGLMSIINGVTSIIQVFNTSTATAQIAATTTNTAMLGALTAAVSANTAALGVQSAFSLLPFATGGVVRAANGFVPGNNHTDDIPVMVSSGELILNRAQQGNLASQMEGAQQQSGSSTPYVCGEQIYLGLTNYLRRSGRGELLTARG